MRYVKNPQGMKSARFATMPKTFEPEPERAQKPGIKPPPEPVTGETQLSPEDAHIGGTEDQVSDRQAPAGDLFEDEPRQG